MKTSLKPELLRMKSLAAETAGVFVNTAFNREIPVKKKEKQWRATIYHDYAALETAWRQLESSGHCTVFQGYDYAASLYDAASSIDTAKPLIVAVSKGDGGIAWILPLCIYRRKNLRIIGFADFGVADYIAPLIAPDAPSDHDSVIAMLESVFAALPPCDLINFQKLVANVENVSNPFLFLQGLERFPVECHGIRITEPWPELAHKIMQRTLRNTIRREKGRLEKKGIIAIEHCDTPETLEPALKQLITMRQERFRMIGLPEMQPVWQDFYRILAMREGRKIYAGITTMTVNGQPVATCFGLTRGKTYYALLTTFKMGEWEHYRPGIQLFDILLTKFAEQTGNDGYFDFTIGDEVYKKRLGSDTRLLYEWMAVRSLKGLPYYMAWRIKRYFRRYPRIFMILQKAADFPRDVKKRAQKMIFKRKNILKAGNV